MAVLDVLEYFLGGLLQRAFGDLTIIGIVGMFFMVILMVVLGVPTPLVMFLSSLVLMLFSSWGIISPAFVWVGWAGLALGLVAFIYKLVRGY